MRYARGWAMIPSSSACHLLSEASWTGEDIPLSVVGLRSLPDTGGQREGVGGLADLVMWCRCLNDFNQCSDRGGTFPLPRPRALRTQRSAIARTISLSTGEPLDLGGWKAGQCTEPLSSSDLKICRADSTYCSSSDVITVGCPALVSTTPTFRRAFHPSNVDRGGRASPCSSCSKRKGGKAGRVTYLEGAVGLATDILISDLVFLRSCPRGYGVGERKTLGFVARAATRASFTSRALVMKSFTATCSFSILFS